MGRALARLGDRTTHGGKIITASPYTFSMGKAVARVGDLVKCPKKGHGINPIITGDPTLIIDGKPAARHGDKCACGCTLIASQHNTTTGGAGESSELLDDDSLAEMSFEDFFFAEGDSFAQDTDEETPLEIRFVDADGFIPLNEPIAYREGDDHLNAHLDGEGLMAFQHANYGQTQLVQTARVAA